MNQLKPSPIKAIMIPAINPMIAPPQTAFGPFKKNKNNKISANIVKIVHIIFLLFYLFITTKLSRSAFLPLMRYNLQITHIYKINKVWILGKATKKGRIIFDLPLEIRGVVNIASHQKILKFDDYFFLTNSQSRLTNLSAICGNAGFNPLLKAPTTTFFPCLITSLIKGI